MGETWDVRFDPRSFPPSEGFDPRSFSPWDGRSPVSLRTCDVPFPAMRTGRYRKVVISARPYQEIGLGSRDLRLQGGGTPLARPVSKERLGDWDGQEDV